jgi:glycosyltransferase involved in cell wall biosynthesis
MHVLFVHPNYPAQFGHIARHLATGHGWRCSYVSETPAGRVDLGGGAELEKIQYRQLGGATRQNHLCTRTFENNVWHCDGVLRAMAGRPDIRPDLIVGHSGFGSTLFLRELYPDVPCVNLFEYYYLPHDPESDMTFRRDLAWTLAPEKFLRSRCRNAMILLDLQNCQLGYCPTQFQRSRFPAEYATKLRVIFDGIDRSLWNSRDESLRPSPASRGAREVAGIGLPAGATILTYCSRGFESMRGFDIFMRAVRRITQADARVHVFVVGTDRIAYGGDEQYTGGKSFRQWTMELPDVQGAALDRVHFVGRLSSPNLSELLASSDLHIYLTVPFVLSWSMLDAMSCGAVVLGSDTSPVRELISDGHTGLVADFFDPEDFAAKALRVLADPAAHRPLGRAAEALISEQYSMEATLPAMLRMYEEALQTRSGLEAPRAPVELSAPPSQATRKKSPFLG